jgi:hypothetical protein
MVQPVRKVASSAERAVLWVWRRTVRSELGEGVISAAIAVLIMAFLGVAMWIGFRGTLGTTQHNVDNQVTKIGSDSGTNAGTPSGSTGGVGGTAGTGGTSGSAPAGG